MFNQNPLSMKLNRLFNGRLNPLFLSLSLSLLIGALWFKLPHPLVAAVALLPVLALIGLMAPFLLSLAFVAFSFFRIHEVFPQLYPLHIPQLLAIGTLASLGFNLLIGRLKGFWCTELSLFAVFFILVTIGVMIASNRAVAMGTWTGSYVKIGIMVIAIAWLIQRPAQLRLVLIVMLFCGLAVGIVTLRNKFQGLELVEGTRVTIGRSIGSVLGDPNDLSLVLLFPASFALAAMLTNGLSKSLRVIGLATFLIVISAIIATQSRGGLLGICAVMGIFGYNRVRNKVLLFGMAAVALSVLFVLAGVTDRASGGAHEEGIDESAMGRIYAWQAAIGMALHHPLTGVGLNNFLSNYFSYSPHWDGLNHAVHSTWFGVLAETGFLGLIVFIAIIISIAKISLQAVHLFSPSTSKHLYNPILYAIAQAIQAGLAGFCVSGTFLTMGFAWPIYILLSLAVSVSMLMKRHLQSVLQNEKQDKKTANKLIKQINKTK